MGARKQEIQFPTWAPADLVQHALELRPKAEEETKRAKAGEIRVLDKNTDLENGELYVGMHFVGHSAEYKIAKALISEPGMETVWKNLRRHNHSFKPIRFLFGGATQARNLHGACLEAETRWINLPKRTPTESRKLHRNIAALSLQLAELLLQVESRGLLDIRKFIDKGREHEFLKALVRGGYDLWPGFEGYMDHLLGGLIEPMPGLLLKLHKRSLEQAEIPMAVSRPHSRNAKVNYFIRELSEYFSRAYNQPLHAHVAAVVSAVLNADVDEDRVRALIRSRKVATKNRTRKKMAEMRKEIDG
jgi:hypothetical protein